MALFMEISFLSLRQWCLRSTLCWQALILPLDEVVLPFSSPGSSLLALCHPSPAASANICIVIQFRDVMDVETNLPNKKKLEFDLDQCFVLLHCSCQSSLGARVECSGGRGRVGLLFGRQCWLLAALKLECRGSLNPSNCKLPSGVGLQFKFSSARPFLPNCGEVWNAWRAGTEPPTFTSVWSAFLF